MIHTLDFGNFLCRLLEAVVEISKIIISHVFLLFCKVVKVIYGGFIVRKSPWYGCRCIVNAVNIITAVHLLLIVLCHGKCLGGVL